MCLENWGQVQVFTCWVEAVPLQWHSCPEISILRVYSFLISLQCSDALIPKKEKEWGCSSPAPPQHESQVQILQIEWKCNAILEMLQGLFVFTIFMLVVALIPLALTVGIFVWERFLMPQSEPILWPCSFFWVPLRGRVCYLPVTCSQGTLCLVSRGERHEREWNNWIWGAHFCPTSMDQDQSQNSTVFKKAGASAHRDWSLIA